MSLLTQNTSKAVRLITIGIPQGPVNYQDLLSRPLLFCFEAPNLKGPVE